MAIRYFNEGEHSGGFIGWRVVVPAGHDRNYQRYFSDRPRAGISPELWSKRQQLRAQIYNASRQARAILRQYRNLVRTDSRNTHPSMAVGATGIRMYARQVASAPGRWEFGFLVSRGSGTAPWHFPILAKSLTESWNEAVNAWADLNEVRHQDRENLRNRKPEATRFKELRRFLNEQRNKDIPTEALGPVFREQREALARQKAQQSLGKDSLKAELADFYNHFSKEIEQHQANGSKE